MSLSECSCQTSCTCEYISFKSGSIASESATMIITNWLRIHVSSPNVPREDLSKIILQYCTLTPLRVQITQKYRHKFYFKILLAGDPRVGKTCLLRRVFNNSYSDSYISTIGIDFKIKMVFMDDTKMKMQIWDTAGDERFKGITTAYYRGAMGILVVYDMTKEQSFLNITNYIQSIRANASDNVHWILIGNKCDLVDDLFTPKQRGKELADKYGVKFFATSAKSDTNVLEAFGSVVENIKKRIEKRIEEQPKVPKPASVCMCRRGCGNRHHLSSKRISVSDMKKCIVL